MLYYVCVSSSDIDYHMVQGMKMLLASGGECLIEVEFAMEVACWV